MHGKSLAPGSDPQLQVDEPTVTVLTNDPHFAGSVDMSLFASGQQNQLYNLKLTITPATRVPQSTPVEVAFGNVPQPIPGLKTGIVSSAQSGNEYFKVLYPTVTKTGGQMYTDTYTSAQGLGIVALCPFYSCWVGRGVSGVLVASRAWCVQAAVTLACPAVLEDPDGEQIVAAGRSGCGRRGA